MGKIHRQSQEDDYRLTGTLVVSIIVGCVGNPFLYGYQIGVVNQPTDLIKTFYLRSYYERNGGTWEHMANYKEYMKDVNMTDAQARSFYNITTDPSNLNLSVKINSTKQLHPEHFGADSAMLMDESELDLMWAITVAAFVCFGMIGAFGSGKFADAVGRKKGMIFITVIMFLAAITGGISQMVSSPECLIVSRVLVGLHSGMCITLCPMYLAEISPQKIRGAIGTVFQLFVTSGILMSQIFGLTNLLGTEDLWPWLFGLMAIPAFISLIGLPFCPESPRFLLINKGEEDEAIEALEKFRGTSNVADEIEAMRIEASKSSSVKNFTMKELLTAPELRMSVLISCFIQIAQQWSGINAVFAYSTSMFKMVQIPDDMIQYVVVGTGTINCLCTIVAVPLMEKAGRRPLLLYPTMLMLVSFIVMTVSLNLQTKPEFEDTKATLAMVCIVMMHTFIFGFALGLGPIPYLVVGEIFRQEPRAAAMSLSMAIQWVCNFLLLLLFPFLKNALEEFVYVLFMAIIGSSIVFFFFFVPETKNKSFDEIASSISFGGRAKGKSSRYGVNTEEMQPMRRRQV